MKNFLEKNKHLQDLEDEDEESMDYNDMHSQKKEQQVVQHDDQKGKQVVQSDVHLHYRKGDRVCEECGKRFLNGKALGGHRKAHFNQSLLPKKTNNKFKPKINKHHLSLNDGSSNSNPCYVCNKNFPSIKSLHGHMRLHRERDWKGVRPPGLVSPPSNKSNSSYSYESDCEEDDGGSGGDSDCATGLSDHTIETVDDAANFLVNLAKIEHRRQTSLANQRVRNSYSEDHVGESSGKKPIEESPYKCNTSSKNSKLDGKSNKKITTETSKSAGGTRPIKDKQIPSKPQESGCRRSDTISDVNMDDSEFSKYADEQSGELSGKKPIESPVGFESKPSLIIKLKLDGRSSKTMEASKSTSSASLVPNKLTLGAKEEASKDDDDDDDESADKTSWMPKPKKTMMKSKTGTKLTKDTGLLDQTHKQTPRKTQEFGTEHADKEKCQGISATSTQVLDRSTEEAEAVEHDGSIKQFECNICPCKFSTGQALRGHKRGHNYKAKPGEEAQGTAEVAPMELEDGEISTEREKFDLDLNQLPHVSDDEGIGG